MVFADRSTPEGDIYQTPSELRNGAQEPAKSKRKSAPTASVDRLVDVLRAGMNLGVDPVEKAFKKRLAEARAKRDQQKGDRIFGTSTPETTLKERVWRQILLSRPADGSEHTTATLLEISEVVKSICTQMLFGCSETEWRRATMALNRDEPYYRMPYKTVLEYKQLLEKSFLKKRDLDNVIELSSDPRGPYAVQFGLELGFLEDEIEEMQEQYGLEGPKLKGTEYSWEECFQIRVYDLATPEWEWSKNEGKFMPTKRPRDAEAELLAKQRRVQRGGGPEWMPSE
jgi:hypothetical protein